MAGVVLSPSSVSVAPGSDAIVTVTVRNTSAVVESYSIDVLGDAAGWATPTPSTLSLFPGTDGTSAIHFRPPRTSASRAGTVDFAVRVAATQNADDTVVEEGMLTVEPFVDITARLTPRTSETKRTAKHVVSIDNRGNAPVTVSVAATDPDELLAFSPDPPTMTVEAGDSGASVVKVAATSGFMRGPAQHRPFNVMVTAPPDSGHAPVMLDGTLVQKAGLPKFVPVLAAVVVVGVLAAVLFPALTKDDAGGGRSALTGANATTTVPAGAPAGEAGDEGEAEAEAETSSGGSPAGAGGGQAPATTAAAAKPGGAVAGASGGQQATATTAPAITNEESPTTTPNAAPIAPVLPKPKSGLPVLFPSFEGDTDEEIWKINPDGTGKVKLTNNPQPRWSVGARWNYAGTLITYTHANGPIHAWIMNGDGSNQHDATPTCGTNCSQPAFSPDGKLLAYAREAAAGAGTYDIWVADVSAAGATSNHRALVATAADEQYPAFAPDGRLAFQRNSSGWKVVVRQTDGGESVVASGEYPAWSPTNDRLMYVSGDVFVTRLDGSASINLTPATGSDERWPFWSADGNAIGFATTRWAGTWHVALANADGSSVRQLTSSSWAGQTGSGFRRHHWVGGWF
jgi:hypothetical protein